MVAGRAYQALQGRHYLPGNSLLLLKSYHTEALPKLKQPKMGVIGLESDKRKERQEEEAGDLESIGVGEEAGGREAVQVHLD